MSQVTGNLESQRRQYDLAGAAEAAGFASVTVIDDDLGKANRARSRIRSAVETVFAAQKHRFGLFVRTIGLARARTKIGLANLAYNLNRFIWIETRAAAA